MKTDDLINAIAADADAPGAPIGWVVWAGAAVGVVAAALLFYVLLPMRPDMEAAFGDWHFLMKWAFSITLLATAMVLVVSLARPQWTPSPKMLLLLAAPAVLALGVAAEMVSLPASYWMPSMIGTNAVSCILYVPLLSGLPLAAMIIALRQGAPARPALAGAVAGLVAAGIAASFYATHCQNDSPLFLAAWYVLATAIVAGVGALAGALLLRW
ncbi:MAG: DUF1109 domain-containing protein [Hyphomicrobium sp.]